MITLILLIILLIAIFIAICLFIGAVGLAVDIAAASLIILVIVGIIKAIKGES